MTRLATLIAATLLTLGLLAGPAAAHSDTRCSHWTRSTAWGERAYLVAQGQWGISGTHYHVYSHRVRRYGRGWVQTHTQTVVCPSHWWSW